jgi:c-di-GMP-binding flagellar brake protein YcgR
VQDRRAFLRVVAGFAASVTVGEDEPFAAHTVNLSAGGALIEADRPVAPGTDVRLEFAVSSPRILVFTSARVVRAEAGDEGGVHRFAVRFVDLDRYVEQRLVRWVFAEDRRVAERRAAVRVPIHVLATCRESANGEAFRAGTIDVAADGARIVTDKAITTGERIRIEFSVDEPAYHVAAVAEVVWAQRMTDGRYAYGLRFENLDRATQRAIVDHALRAANA